MTRSTPVTCEWSRDVTALLVIASTLWLANFSLLKRNRFPVRLRPVLAESKH
jgi:hypothetical protein